MNIPTLFIWFFGIVSWSAESSAQDTYLPISGQMAGDTLIIDLPKIPADCDGMLLVKHGNLGWFHLEQYEDPIDPPTQYKILLAPGQHAFRVGAYKGGNQNGMPDYLTNILVVTIGARPRIKTLSP